MSTGGTPQGQTPYQSDPMFGNLGGQAGMPDLITLLVEEYKAACARNNQDPNKEQVDPQEDLDAAEPLLVFFREYLDRFRPVQSFPADNNYGLLLSNNLRCLVSPAGDIRGTMQNSGAIGVMQGRSNPGQDGVIPMGDEGQI